MAHQSSGNSPSPHPHDEYPHYINASDVGSYLYCRRSWWLERIQGWEPDDAMPRRARGVSAHRQHGCLVWLSRTLTTIAWICTIAVSLIAVAMWLGWWPW